MPSDNNATSVPPNSPRAWMTRPRVQALALAGLTIAALYLCYRISAPFLPALTWAVALALVTRSVHRWVATRVSSESLAAGLALAIVALGILIPAAFVVQQIAVEARQTAEQLRANGSTDPVAIAEQTPWVASQLEWVKEYVDIQQQVRVAAGAVAAWISQALAGSAWAAIEFLIVLYFLFYLFRDGGRLARHLRELLPLASVEADAVLERVDQTIRATVYGTLVVAAVQGVLGGLMFWWLGLPAAILWGVVMGLLAVVPVLGAFVVWVPAAVGLLIVGDWGKALMLTAWGTIVVGMIDNLLYPMLVGAQLRLHTVPVFIAIVGGLTLFGAAGVILGPALFAATSALLDVWRGRTAGGKAADQAGGTALRPAETHSDATRAQSFA